jgi:D-alanyl-D-alanine carboxypeptidase
MSALRNSVRGTVLAVTAAVVAVLMIGGSYAYAARPGTRPGGAPADLQQAADKLVADGQPGVIIMTRRGSQVGHVTAGVADKATGEPMRPRDRVHIGSTTKTFVATVVLQLVAEGRLSLDDSVQKWLPGVVTGPGYHPARITVRQLLQHTSGLRDYLGDPVFQTPQGLGQTWQPRQLVGIALHLGPPLRGWNYSNTNYILLGMLIEKVTGQSPIAEIDRRILIPLGLHDTSFPLTSRQIPGPQAHGYYGNLDVTTLVNPSSAWTAGAMISTADDVARFYRAVLTGRLLPPAEQRELTSAIAVDDPGELFAEHYGLGIYRVHLPCGTAWGHDGGYPGGFRTFAYTSPNGGRQAVIIYNDFKLSDGTDNPVFRHDVQRATDIAFCG